jgi:hypothetical protein
MRPLLLLLLLTASLMAQDSAHWGLQADYFAGDVPRAIVENIKDLPEQPDIDAKAYNMGLVRFHRDGSPNWSFEFSRAQIRAFGAYTQDIFRYELHADAILRGAMFTKYLNFVSKRRFSAGFAFGGGVGQVDGRYTRYFIPPPGGRLLPSDRDTIQRVVPLFQAVAQVDVRPVRWISLSPFYGLRNGVLGVGGAIRIHFTR